MAHICRSPLNLYQLMRLSSDHICTTYRHFFKQVFWVLATNVTLFWSSYNMRGYSFGWNHWDLWLWSFCVFGLCCRFNLCTCFDIWSCLHEIIYLGFLRTFYIYLKKVCVTFRRSSREREFVFLPFKII